MWRQILVEDSLRIAMLQASNGLLARPKLTGNESNPNFENHSRKNYYRCCVSDLRRVFASSGSSSNRGGQGGYLFGAFYDGKWIKANETGNLISAETTYRVYGLTQAPGEAKAARPKSNEVPCEETLAVFLSPKPETGVVAIAAPWNPLPRKPKVIDPTENDYVDAVRDFLESKGIKKPG